MDAVGGGLAEQGGDDAESKTIVSRGGRNTLVNPWEDFTRTVFIGNLPFVVSEEELRAQFTDCGKIENIRIVRDPKTHLGKGIGYVMFTDKEQMQKALDSKKGLKFKGRELRIKRAVEPKRREKKELRKKAALEERREKRRQRQAAEDSDDEPLPPKNFGDAYSSEDSDDEKIKKRKAERQIRLEDTSFGKRTASQADHDSKRELDLTNMHKMTKRRKQDLLASMIKKGTSLKKETASAMSADEKDLYKGKHDTFKKGLIQKIAKHKADNLKKINKIKIKTKKI